MIAARFTATLPRACIFLPKSRMNTYTQCEPIDTATGQSHLHLCTLENPYAFMHKVAAQIEPAEIISKTIAHGWPKRNTFAVGPHNSAHDESVPWQASDREIQDMHEWMCQNFLPHRTRIKLDGLSQDMYDAVKRAVKDFVQEYKRRVRA